MAVPIGLSIGRVRVTRVVSVSEAGYIRNMRKQADNIVGKLVMIANRFRDATPGAIRYALQPIYEQSQIYVPVRTGKLKRSGFILAEAEKHSGRVRALIGYARHGQPHYAAFVHEMIHIPHAGVTQAKFLEKAVREKIWTFKARLVESYKAQTGLK